MSYFIASYEDAAKVEAAAKKRGFTGNDGESWHDFIEAELPQFQAARKFTTFGNAKAWLISELRATKSVYGAGEIVEIEPVTRRCKYCICGGAVAVRRFIVDDEDSDAGEALDPRCVDDD